MKKKLSLIFVFMFMLLGLVALNTKPVMAASETEVEAELNNIVLPDKAIIDFPVVSVSVYGSTIEWKSDRTDVISVPTNGGWTTVKRQNVDVTVTLTVTLTNGEIVKTKDFEVKVPKGTTLTNTYKIEYVLNGGTNNAQNPTEYKVGETKELLTPTKGEVEFLGWFNNEKFEGEAITSLPKGLSGDYKLYAKWAPATVTGIEVTTLPTTVNYKALETFDKTGLVVSKLLNDGTKEVVALDELTFDKDVLHYGDKQVVVTYADKFTATIDITVVKKDYNLSGIKFEDASLTYNGKEQTINFTGDLLDGLTAKVEGSATNVTTTPVTITLVFTNTNADYNTPENMTAELTITKAPLKVTASSASIKVGEDVPRFTASYDGFVNGETASVLKGELTITCSATKTSPAGSYDVVPSGLTAENYEIEFVNGTLTITSGTYTIVASNTTVTYNGENQMFTVVLKDGETVIEGITFTYTLNDAAFTGATNAGTYEVTVSYNSETYGQGTTVVTFVIEKANYNLDGISLDQTALTYNGEKQNLKLVGTLPEGVSAVFSEGLTNVGTKEIVVTFTHSNANYNEITTTLTSTLTINAKTLENDMFDVIPEQAYTGSAITPEVTGKFNGTALVLGTDFDVEYTSNTDKGTATVTVAGKGNFTGTAVLTFVIGDSALEKAKAAREALVTKYSSVLTGTLASTVTKLDVVAENGSVITWASNNTVIKVEKDGTVTILAAETDQDVTLTATISYGDVSPEYATFKFVVKAAEKIEEKTIQEMIAAEVDETKYFKLTGIVTNLAANDAYGNFYLVDLNDSSISIYVYGLLSEKGGQKGQFKSLGIVEGDTVTLIGTRGEYNGKIEVMNAYYVSHKKNEVTLTVTSEDETKGTVTPTTSVVENGTEITITITPAEGYKVSKIVINGQEKDLSENTIKIIVSFNTTVVIKFVDESAEIPSIIASITFPDENKASNNVSAYNKTWEAKSGIYNWSISNFNNNSWNNSWTYIKCGSKSDDSVATITTDEALSKNRITSVIVTVDKATTSSVNSFKLIVYSDASCSKEVTSITKTIATGDIEFVIDSQYQATGLYYKLEINCKKAKGNGIVQISKLVYKGFAA